MQGDTDRTLPLDEEEEQYGFGLLNVNRNEFVNKLGATTNPDIVPTKEELREHFQNIAEKEGFEDPSDVNHLRVVRVHLDNDVDAELCEDIFED